MNVGMARLSRRRDHLAPGGGVGGGGEGEARGRHFGSTKPTSEPPTFSDCWKWHPSFGDSSWGVFIFT